MVSRIDYADPDNIEIEHILIELRHNASSWGRQLLREQILKSYEQGAKDTRNKFVDACRGIITLVDINAVINGTEKPVEYKEPEPKTDLLLDEARKEFNAGDTRKAVGLMLTYLIDNHDST